MKKIAPSERMEQDLMRGLVTDADPLGEAARRGAQLILQKALEAEVSDFRGLGEEIATKERGTGR